MEAAIRPDKNCHAAGNGEPAGNGREQAKQRASGLLPFAAVCAMALSAFGTIACSGHIASQAPLQMSHQQAPDTWPMTGSDPSLPSAAQALQGRAFDAGEPAPTF